jgi:hypothetical protein
MDAPQTPIRVSQPVTPATLTQPVPREVNSRRKSRFTILLALPEPLNTFPSAASDNGAGET